MANKRKRTPQYVIRERMQRFEQQANRIMHRSRRFGFFQHFERYKDSSGFTRWRLKADLDPVVKREAADGLRKRIHRESFRIKRRKPKKSKNGSDFHNLSIYSRDTYNSENETLDQVVQSHLNYNKKKGDCVGMTQYFTAMCEWFGIESKICDITGHIFTADPQGTPIEMGVWDGTTYVRVKNKRSCYYGHSVEIMNDYNLLFSTILHQIATDYDANDKIKLTRKFYMMALRASKKGSESAMELAESIAKHDKNYRRALGILERHLKRTPEHTGFILRSFCNVYNNMGEHEKALESILAASKEFNHKEDNILEEIGQQCCAMEDYKRAIYWFKRTLSRRKYNEEPTGFEMLYDMAHAYSEIDQYKEAHKTVDLAIKKADDFDEYHRAYLMKGMLYWDEERYHLASHWLRKAIKAEVMGIKEGDIARSSVSKNPLRYLWKCAQKIEDRRRRKRIKRYVTRHATPEQLESLKQLREEAA
ncbi:tetratricopeptide repeat protein [Candidatus Woesearchaeota archaeon]|nr:tetratricopeptide repeat protein [Candidatus Woesearchaeota archaeon]